MTSKERDRLLDGSTHSDLSQSSAHNPTYSPSVRLSNNQGGGNTIQAKKYAYESLNTKPTREDLTIKTDSGEDEDENGTALAVSFVLMLIFQLGNRIYGRLMTYPMHNYPAFINILSVFIYVPVCFAYIIPVLHTTNIITKEQQEIPKHKFAVMGAYDSIAGIMQTFAVNYITNSGIIVLVQQSAIPISMAISYIALNAKYTTAQYAGAVVVLLGIGVVLIPQMFPSLIHPSVVEDQMMSPHDNPHNHDYDDYNSHIDHSHRHLGQDTASAASEGTSDADMLWILILVVSCVPMCLSSVYKEKALGEVEMDVIYLNGWVAVFQFLMAIPLIIPSAWVIDMPMEEIMPNMYGGLKCWFGENTVMHDTEHLIKDNCSAAPLYVNLYIFFNLGYNVLIVVILKYGSSNILWMSSTVIVPLSNVAFSMKMMPNHQPMTDFDVIGLVVIMLGLLVYRFTKEMFSFVSWLSGAETDPLELEDTRRGRMLSMRAERKQTKYIGINQIEGVQSLFYSRVAFETAKALFRSPSQIRSSLLLRLGIPPSPNIGINYKKMKKGDRGSSFIEIKPERRGSSFVEMSSTLIKPRSNTLTSEDAGTDPVSKSNSSSNLMKSHSRSDLTQLAEEELRKEVNTGGRRERKDKKNSNNDVLNQV